MNSTECPFLFVLSYLGANIGFFPQTTKDLGSFFLGDVCRNLYMMTEVTLYAYAQNNIRWNTQR